MVSEIVYTRESRKSDDVRTCNHEDLPTLVISYDTVSHVCRESGQVLSYTYEITANKETIFSFDDSMDGAFAYDTYRKTLGSIGYHTRMVV